MPDKDPWCCASDKLSISVDGFNAGYLAAMRSVRYIISSLPKDEALWVVDQLIEENENRTSVL